MRDAGVSTIEVVLLAPLMILFVLFIVAFGLIVDAQGQANGAARDAARIGALQRDEHSALEQAGRVANVNLGNKCAGGPQVQLVSATFAPGELFTVRVTCRVSLAGLDLLGLGASKTVTAQSTAPLDTFRRAG